MPPVVLKTRGVKAAFSTFKTLELYFLFFSISWLMYIAGILLDALDGAIGYCIVLYCLYLYPGFYSYTEGATWKILDLLTETLLI